MSKILAKVRFSLEASLRGLPTKALAVALAFYAAGLGAQGARPNSTSSPSPSLLVGVVTIAIGQPEKEVRRRLEQYYEILEIELEADTSRVQVSELGKSVSDGYPILGLVTFAGNKVIDVYKTFQKKQYEEDDYTMIMEGAFSALQSHVRTDNCAVRFSRPPGTRLSYVFHYCGRYTLSIGMSGEEPNNPKVTASLSVR